jgi:hypothetical protein
MPIAAKASRILDLFDLKSPIDITDSPPQLPALQLLDLGEYPSE